MKMIGSEAHPKLKTKGAETFGLMRFLLVLLRQYGARLGSSWNRLLQAGDALDTMIGIWSKHSGSWTIPADDRKATAMKGSVKKIYADDDAWAMHLAVQGCTVQACFVCILLYRARPFIAQAAMDAYLHHLALMAAFDCFVPKHHIVIHLLRNTGFQGNPLRYSTWLDESLNKLLKAACKHASSATLYRSVLLKMRDLLSKV
jgi:hypothetical protein